MGILRNDDAEYKTKSLDGSKPITNPRTNPNPNTNPIQLFYAFSRITIPQNTRRRFSEFGILLLPSHTSSAESVSLNSITDRQ